MCKHSNSLYNSTLYVINTYFKETGKYLTFNELYHIMKINEHYISMPRKISNQIIRLVDKEYRSFFALLRRKINGNYHGRINPPKYRKKGGEFILILPNDQVKLKNNVLKITKDIKLNFNHIIEGIVKQLIIIPRYKGYYDMCIQYDETKNNQCEYELNEKNYLSIDLGINNLCACFSNVGPSFIINGKPIKSYNQFYNKRKSIIQSALKKINDKNWSSFLSLITHKRNNWINNYFNQSVNKIIQYCFKYKIKNIVIGYNELWKKECNMGKINNQKFYMIPYDILKRKISNKCNFLNMKLIYHEESYTSKCSFLDNESIQKHDNYIGRRIKRGLFETQNGLKLNADINGASNILRKVISNFLVNDEIVASMVKPIILNVI